VITLGIDLGTSSVKALLLDTEHFVKKGMGQWSQGIGENWLVIPTEADPPIHNLYRKELNPHFTPQKITVMGERIRERAKTLIDETAMPMSAIAFAAGFTSIRRFNEAFRAVYRRPPSALRRGRRRAAERRRSGQSVAGTVATRQIRRASLSMLSATIDAATRKQHATAKAAP